jgi:tetratricopeptide (TPR) repeat protein
MEGVAGKPPVDRPAGGTRPQAPGGDAAADAADGAANPGMMEQVQKEIASLKATLEKDPKNLAALTRLGDMYFDVGKFDGAKEYYSRALAASPDDINVKTDLGITLRNLGEPAEAMKLFEASVAADPRHWKGWFNIGIVAMYDLGDFDRAQKAFEKVSELNPGAIKMDALKEEMAKEKARRASGSGAS